MKKVFVFSKKPNGSGINRYQFLFSFFVFLVSFLLAAQVMELHFMTKIDGGLFTFSKSGHKIWQLPSQISFFLPFIGTHYHQQALNHFAYALAVGVATFLGLLQFAFFLFFIFWHQKKLVLLLLKVVCGWYCLLIALACLYTCFFFIDDSVNHNVRWGMFVNLLLALLVLNIAVRMYFHVKKSKTREFKVFFLNLINFQKNKVAIITTDLATNQNVLIENVFYAKQPNQQSVDQEQSKGLCFWKPWFAKMQVKEQQARERSYENIKANRNNQNQFFNHNFFLGISRWRQKMYLNRCLREYIFSFGSTWVVLWYICFPLVLLSVVNGVYFLFDKILVIAFAPHAYPSLAHSVITSSLNLATRYTSSIDLLMVAFVSFVIYAASIFFSYGFARRNAYETRRVVGNSLVFAFLISVIATALMFAIIPSILRLQIRNNSSSSFVYKLSYHFIIIFVMGLPLRTFGYLLLTFISREGHTFVSLVLLIASLLFNILLNYLLLSQTSLGIIASSLATVSIWFLLVTGCTMFILFDRESAIRCSWYDLFIINRKLILVLVKLGIADFFYNCALAVLFILKIYFVNDLPTASSDLVGNPHNLQSGLVVLLAAGAPWIRLFIAVLQGLGSALLAVVSYCYASGRWRRLWKFTFVFAIIFYGWGIIAFLIIAVFRNPLLKVFIKNHNLPLQLYGEYFIFVAAYFLIMAIPIMSFYLYRGLMRPQLSSFLSLVRNWTLNLIALGIMWFLSWLTWRCGSGTSLIWFFAFRTLADTLTIIFILPLFIITFRQLKYLALHAPYRPSKTDEEMHTFFERFQCFHKSRQRLIQVLPYFD